MSCRHLSFFLLSVGLFAPVQASIFVATNTQFIMVLLQHYIYTHIRRSKKLHRKCIDKCNNNNNRFRSRAGNRFNGSSRGRGRQNNYNYSTYTDGYSSTDRRIELERELFGHNNTIAQGINLMACAQTGSGETAANNNFKQKINNSYGSYNGSYNNREVYPSAVILSLIFVICIAVLGCFELAGDYGIAIAVVGMLSNTADELDGSYALALLAAFKNDAGLNTIDISSAEVLVAVICLGTGDIGTGDMGSEGDGTRGIGVILTGYNGTRRIALDRKG